MVRRWVGLRALVVAILAAPTLAAQSPDPCAGLEPIDLDGRILCTHGPDPAPGGAAGPEEQDVAAARPDVADGPVPVAPVQCYEPVGRLVQVLWAHPAGAPDRRPGLAADLERWVGQVEWTIRSSAARTGGRRHVRWLTSATDDGGCRTPVTSVALPAGAFDSLQDTVRALVDRGFAREDRKYLVFADVHPGLCGVASVPRDDRRVADNSANTHVGFARVDRDCWRTADDGFHSVAAHELVHTLGAVQPSAPHATEGRHCTDEWDLMCYADGGGVTAEVVCEDDADGTLGEGDHHNRLLDCGNDDYFHTDPPFGSYLANHWNVADSAFLSESAASATSGLRRPSDIAADPQGRERVWSGDLGGAHRPLLRDAYGWEVCDLPVSVAIEEPEPESGSGGPLDGLLGGSQQPAGPSPLRSAVEQGAGTINGAVGLTVLAVDAEPWGGGTAPDGTLVVRAAEAADHAVSVSTRDARVRSATLGLPREVVTGEPAHRETRVLQGVAPALGLGRVGGHTQLMSPFAGPGADRSTAMSALRALYDQPCSVDPRLDDTAPGHLSQRVPGGSRERVDLAADAADPIAAGLDVSRWLRGRRGDGWAARAVVCRDDVYADCLSGTALASGIGVVAFVPGGPEGRLPDRVAEELGRALAPTGSVHVLGGPDAVSPQVESALRRALAPRAVERIAGPDRYDTAARVARRVADLDGPIVHALLARGDHPADAVSAGAAAAEYGVPIVLTATDRVPAVTQLALTDIAAEIVLVAGGPAAVDASVVDVLAARGHAVSRLAGDDRAGTAVAIAQATGLWNRIGVEESGSLVGVNGWHDDTWNLAIAAAPVAALLDAPVVFTRRSLLPSSEPDGTSVGGTLELASDLPLTGDAPPHVASVYVGAGTWTDRGVAEAFHGALLPGFDGNVTVSAG